MNIKDFRFEAIVHWTHAMKVALALVTVILLLIAGLVVEYAVAAHVAWHTQQQWCDTLNLLTKDKVPEPADPAANPSREQTYQLYEDFVHLRGTFGCR